VLPRGQLDTQTAQTEEARATVDAAKAAVKTAQLNLGHTKIYAPIEGRIDEASVKVGTLVTANTTLLDTIYSINPIYVDFSVTERAYLNYEQAVLKKGPKPPPLPELNLPNQSTYPYPGKIVMANPAVNPNTGTLQLRAQFPNPQGLLQPGLSVSVKVMVREEANAVLIPQQAIRRDPGTAIRVRCRRQQ
jgi:membrane fusion protein (multidrug efflux system)